MTDMEDRILLTEAEAAKAIGLAPTFLTKHRRAGTGPPFVRISHRCVRYRPADIEQWAENLVRTSNRSTAKKNT
jgi:predicted DNA-binding transcriptional regulator AlpA